MILLDIQRLQALRQRLGALKNSLARGAWRRADALLRKAALHLSLPDGEWDELRALLDPDEAAIPEAPDETGEVPRQDPANAEGEAQISPFEYMRQERERLARLTQAKPMPGQSTRH